MFGCAEYSMNNPISQAVILAGGFGSRLKPFTDTNPKPMYPFWDKPFLEYLVNQVKSFGVKEIVMLLGYLPDKIIEYFGDGCRWGINIKYSITPLEYETGLRIKGAAGLIHDNFLFMYCDNYCPINFKKLQELHFNNDALLTFTAYKNLDGYTKSNLQIAQDGMVITYDKKRQMPDLQGVDIGYALVKKSVLNLLPCENHNFEAVVYPVLAQQQKLFACTTEHRYYSVGSPERLELTKEFLKERKVIFLDRDGTLNVRPPKACYVEKPQDFVWLPGAKEAVVELKKAGYFIILITNQPGIARGNLTEETLAKIHEKMQNDLKEEGAQIDKIYYCNHNWDDGCPCRKPKPGMLFDAQKEFSLDLTKCLLIGDDERDIEAGEAAGCRSILVNDEYTIKAAVRELLQGESP